MSRQEKLTVDGVSPESPLRILYIGGCGRSGSTVLDTLLGNHPAIESVGEACHIAENAWLRDDSYCACGKLGRHCQFWSEVHRRWTQRMGSVDLAAYVDQAREIESRLRLSVTRRQLAQGEPRHVDYVRQTVGLLASIRDATGCHWVVDSSKAASRPLALSMIPGVDLRLVHLVRDCRGVLWSGKKRFSKDARAGIAKDDGGKSILRTMKIWTVANLVAEVLRRQLPREKSIRVRYEDLITQPQVELKRIGDLAEIDMDCLATGVAAGTPMTIGHTIAGNRVRMSGSIQLRPDVEWIEKLTWRDQAACWALVGWLMKAYGYRWRAAEKSAQRRAA